MNGSASPGLEELVSRWGIFAVLMMLFSLLLFLIIAVVIVFRQRRKRAMIGEDEMVGEEGVARTRISPEGDVFVKSELWRAQSAKGVIEAGEKVVVIKTQGLTLIVEKKEEKGD